MESIDENVLNYVLSLPVAQRTALIDRLIESLNVPIDPEIDALWVEEAERRMEEIRDGKVVPIPGEQVFEDIRRRFGK